MQRSSTHYTKLFVVLPTHYNDRDLSLFVREVDSLVDGYIVTMDFLVSSHIRSLGFLVREKPVFADIMAYGPVSVVTSLVERVIRVPTVRWVSVSLLNSARTLSEVAALTKGKCAVIGTGNLSAPSSSATHPCADRNLFPLAASLGFAGVSCLGVSLKLARMILRNREVFVNRVRLDGFRDTNDGSITVSEAARSGASAVEIPATVIDQTDRVRSLRLIRNLLASAFEARVRSTLVAE